MLRYEPPVHATVRFAENDMIYNEKSYKRGTAFAVSIAGANRDPEANANPNEFNILRDDVKHISFGYGPHMCIGASLARIESRIAFETLFERFSNLELLDKKTGTGASGEILFTSPITYLSNIISPMIKALVLEQ